MRGQIIRLAVTVVLCAIAISAVPVRAFATGNCQLCIVEVHTVLEESSSAGEDYVIVYNRSFTKSTTNIKLALITTEGSVVGNALVSIGALGAGQIKVFAGSGIMALNAGAVSLGDMNINPDGGTLQLGYFLPQTTVPTTVYDDVSWGMGAGPEGSVGGTVAPNQSFARKQTAGIVQDTGANADDFEFITGTCGDPQITEIQPFVADSTGAAIHAWVEIAGLSGSPGDCYLATSADGVHTIPAASMPINGQITAVSEGTAATGDPEPLRLGGVAGQVWLANRSAYGGNSFAYAPVAAVAYPAIELGQSWAQVDGLWKATYAMTPGAGNTYQGVPPSLPADPTVCGSVRINEILANPNGDDAGSEWIELHNFGDATAMLASCQIAVGGTAYRFFDYDGLWSGEYRTANILRGSGGSEVRLGLPNSSDEPLLVAWQRINPDGTTDTLQSFYLYDGVQSTTAPEGMSYARSDDGWSWKAPTPGINNSASTEADPVGPTEGSKPNAGGSGGASVVPGAVIEISELLPNPAAPLSDDEDEYVELHNPHNIAVNLAGYTLQTGANFGFSYTFPDQMIAPGEYIVITSGHSKLSLSNTSGAARLLEPTGIAVSQADTYSAAPEGQAWAHVDGVWIWTAAATPGLANVYVPPLIKLTTPALSKKVATVPKTSSSAASKSSAKTKAATTPATKAAKTTKSNESPAKSAAVTTANAAKPSPLHPAVLAVVGGLALLYAAYEYRTDIANRIYQFRRNRKLRRENRQSLKGR